MSFHQNTAGNFDIDDKKNENILSLNLIVFQSFDLLKKEEKMIKIFHSISICFFLFLIILTIFSVKNVLTLNLSDRTSISCNSLNISQLHLLTFDLFGALMKTEESLHDNIAEILPTLSKNDINIFTQLWLDAYVSNFGKTFPPSLTHQPFRWIIQTSLIDILSKFGLSNLIPEGSQIFNSLLSTWANLKPKDGTIEVLTKLSKKYQLALLSNGDQETLESAIRIFPSSVNISLIFSSDYPVNCLKPCSQMYAQALDSVSGNINQVLHVAGSAFDTHGALSFGIYSGALDPSAIHTTPTPCFAFEDIRHLPEFFKV